MNALAGSDREVMTALLAHFEILIQLLVIDHDRTFDAFRPNALGNVALARFGGSDLRLLERGWCRRRSVRITRFDSWCGTEILLRESGWRGHRGFGAYRQSARNGKEGRRLLARLSLTMVHTFTDNLPGDSVHWKSAHALIVFVEAKIDGFAVQRIRGNPIRLKDREQQSKRKPSLRHAAEALARKRWWWLRWSIRHRRV